LRVRAAVAEDRAPVLKRQRLLLALLDRAGGSGTAAWLAQAAFLVSQDRAAWKSSPLYDFVPGRRSFTLEHEVGALVRDGFVVRDGPTLTATPSGLAEAATLDPSQAFALRAAWHRHALADAATLAERMPRESPRAPPAPAGVVYTVGYRGVSIDGFLDALLRRGMGRVVDVRANPASRRLGFHKSTLARLCAEVGLAYAHFPTLGVAKELRAEAASTDAWNRVFEDYAVRVRTLVAELDSVAALLAEQPSALMCAEQRAVDCHRSRLATALAERTGMAVEHVELHGAAGDVDSGG
jgi:hypothetical protein